ncbi:MAG: hypothetical protein QNJ54_32535 [Prochloraceae cyanobacterium]|nr:hypothetical protein [Prochloraceae cyanobacterium]
MKKDLVTVGWSYEQLDFNRVPSQTLQEVSKRVDLAFNRFIKGDKNGNRSGKQGLGCFGAQGYWFSPPLNIEEMTHFLKTYNS